MTLKLILYGHTKFKDDSVPLMAVWYIRVTNFFHVWPTMIKYDKIFQYSKKKTLQITEINSWHI